MHGVAQVLCEVEAEVHRSLGLYGTQEGLSGAQRLAVITEEVGEVARELNDAFNEDRKVDREKLRAELVQSAAMCVKMALVVGKGGTL